MGDIAFNIFKDVNLNKQVTLDINKDVFVNVDNPDQLATAEADAEAFGPFALAEVDAYTVVTPPDMGPPQKVEVGGFVNWLGNTTDYIFGPDDIGYVPDPNNPGEVILDPNPDGASDTITVVFNGPDDGFPPDVDDVNAGGAINVLDGVPAGPTAGDVDLPDPLLKFEDIGGNPLDLELVQAPAVVGGTPQANLLAEYELSQDLYVNFGDRGPIEIDGDGVPTPGNLRLVIPQGTTFVAEFIGGAVVPGSEGEVNIIFESFVDNDGDGLINGAYWIHDGETRPAQADFALQQAGFEIPEGTFEVVEFTFSSDSLNIGAGQGPNGVGNYGFEVTGVYFEQVPGQMDGGTAFAYAESTSALDLSQMMGPIPM